MSLSKKLNRCVVLVQPGKLSNMTEKILTRTQTNITQLKNSVYTITWTSTRETLTLLNANLKGAEQRLRIHAVFTVSHSLYVKCASYITFVQNFNILVNLCRWADWFKAYLLENKIFS